MRNILAFTIIILILSSCSSKNTATDTGKLFEADKTFSDYSAKNGIQKAFIEFAHDSVVILKPNYLPIEGKLSLINFYHDRTDSNVVMTWKPKKALIAESGELGYTYGYWTLIASNDTSQGTYLTVWMKNSKGEWKYIADIGNEGVGN